ncbi:hypothetical protein BDV12DRAFT_203822 [Aspergillus spectabilis]
MAILEAILTTPIVPNGPPVFLAFLISSPILYYLSLGIYNLYFHPLAEYPGPFWARASTIWRIKGYITGTEASDILEAHKKYGEVIRLAPDELSYVQSTAWKEIYGHRAPGDLEFPKDPKHNAETVVENILNSSQEYHAVLRRLLAHGFSEKALRSQEEILQEYSDIMVDNIGKSGNGKEAVVDIVSWYNFFTFDVIGYLSKSLLVRLSLHPWIEHMFEIVKNKGFHQALSRLPGFLRPAFNRIFRPNLSQSTLQLVRQVTKDKIQNRLAQEVQTPGFIVKLIEAYEAGKMSTAQLESNARVLILGGSETTATLLSGATYYLLTNPSALAKLTKEIRATFTSPGEIDSTTVTKCRYLSACLDEALRVYPPSPQTHTRVTPPGGVTVAGKFVPEGITVGVPIFAVCHSPWNFRQPDCFIPERWLNDPLYADDKKEAAQVFSTGPRACLGRNLAFLEMRLVMAKLLWHYDLEKTSDRKWADWADQKIFMLWDKPELMVKLTKRQ